MVFARIAYVVSALLLGASVLAGVTYSSAFWTDSSTTTATVGASPDWTPPTVSVDDPGFLLDGTRFVPVTAADEHSSVATVAVQYQRNGTGTWTTICTDNGAPWGCSWNTTTVSDGTYHLRAIATDAYANATTSATITRDVVNTASVVIDPVPNPTRGEVELTARAVGPGSASSTITFQYATNLAGPYANIPGCTNLPGPDAVCDFDTTPNSGTFHMRAAATFNSNTYYDVQPDIVVDNAAPSVTLTVPGTTVNGLTWVSGSINIAATASDAHTAVTSVLFEHRAVGAGSWTTCLDDTSSPYGCTLDTTVLAEGAYELRATATDTVGNTTTTATQVRYVDRNNPTGTLTVPGTTYTGAAVTMSIDALDAGTGVKNVIMQYKRNVDAGWTTLCTDTSVPYECTTPNLTNNTLYNFRATVTDNRDTTFTTPVQNRTVDTSAPSVTQSVPAGTLSGTISWTATATDTGSGIANVTFQYRLTGSGTWVNACVDNLTPFSCSFNTATVANGSYDFRAVATNNATLTANTTTQVRTITNGTAAITAPAAGANVLGPVTVTAAATAPSGVASVALQYRPGASGAWTTICTDNVAPYTCSWATSSLTAGSYQLQAVNTATNGSTVTSAAVTVTVERFRGASIGVSSTGTAGLPDAGDQITFTFTNTVDLTTVKAGWSGASTSAALTFSASTIQPRPANADYLSFVSGINLGQLSFNRDYVDNGNVVSFPNATMVASTTTLNGRTVTVITVTVGAPTTNASALNTQVANTTTSWYPSASVLDTNGTASLTTTVVETVADPDF